MDMEVYSLNIFVLKYDCKYYMYPSFAIKYEYTTNDSFKRLLVLP